MGVKLANVAAAVLVTAVLASFCISQETVQPDRVAASAFERAVQAEGGPLLKRIYNERLRDFCAGDARRWGDGIVVYASVTFVSEDDLASKMMALVHQWKTTGSKKPAFDANEFPRLRRYAITDCGHVDGQAKVFVAAYRSGWDTYWARLGNLLGK